MLNSRSNRFFRSSAFGATLRAAMAPPKSVSSVGLPALSLVVRHVAGPMRDDKAKAIPRWTTSIVYIVVGAMLLAVSPVQNSIALTAGPETWSREPLPQELEGRVVAVRFGREVFIYSGNACKIYSVGSAPWKDCPLKEDSGLPFQVDAGFAVADGGDGNLYLLTSDRQFFQYDVQKGEYRKIAEPTFAPINGVRLSAGEEGVVYAVSGMRKRHSRYSRLLFRYDIGEDQWESLGRLKMVNVPGRYSSGMVGWKGGIFLWGDHHISRYAEESGEWDIVYYVLRYRPFLGRGGTFAFDASEGRVFYTLGAGSNSVGVLSLPEKRFDYLRPRLPVPIENSDETLFITGELEHKRLNLLSVPDQQVFSIPISSLRAIGKEGPGAAADVGSIWRVHNIGNRGSAGDLVRFDDSYTNALYVPPYLYYQRKNLLRRMDLKTLRASPQGAFLFHENFITEGAGFAYDGQGHLYLFTGRDQRFFRVDLRRQSVKEPWVGAREQHEDIGLLGVEELPALPRVPGKNTALAYHQGNVWAVMSAEDRKVYRYDPVIGSWESLGELPDSSNASAALILSSTGDQLYLVRGRSLYRYVSGSAFQKVADLKKEVSRDGGMVAFDKARSTFYIAVGGGSRDLIVVDEKTGASHLFKDSFPDVVSVAGQRMWVEGDELYIWRGQDSAEMWKVRLDDLATGVSPASGSAVRSRESVEPR